MEMEKMQVEWIAINKVKPYGKNPRRNDGAVDAVAKSIQEFGWKQPLVIDPDTMEIIVGHTRYKASKKLGLKTVPCVLAHDLTEEQKKAYRLADNKTNELAEWDDFVLDDELASIKDIDMGDFGFVDDFALNDEEEYERKKAEFAERMKNGEINEEDEEYQEFLQKFELKKTTDDCYTPPAIYEAVADYVAEKYNVKKSNFVRPFYPGGDYEKEKYKKDSVVVDNPPFSILSQICKWYVDKGIPFFLFAPGLTTVNVAGTQMLLTGVTVEYENGAKVCTSFVTNMDEYKIRSAPDLYKKIASIKKEPKTKAKYDYPNELVTAAMVNVFSKYGIEYKVKENQCHRVTELEEQKAAGRGIFGGGFLLGAKAAAEKAAAEKAAAEKAAAEKAAAEKWQLSEKEKAICARLTCQEVAND